MGFSESGIPVNKEWIVDLAGSLAYGVSSSSSELIGLTYYKKVERVTLTERRGASAVLCQRRLSDGGWRRDKEIHLRTLLPLFVHAEYHIHRIPKDYWAEARQ